MDSQIVIKTGEWKIKVILGIGGLVTLVILAFLYKFEIGLVLLACGGILAIRLGFWIKNKYTLERLQARQLEAQTRQAELEADRQHWQVQQERAIAEKLKMEALFIEQKAGTFVIGNVPFAFYPSASASKELATVQPLALPSPSLDFYQAMSDSQQAYAIVGAQRVGKSIMAQHLAQYLTNKGIGCLVVGTKAAKGEWLNCDRRIGNEAVPTALSSLLEEIKSRTENSVNTPKLAVFLDDWLNSVALDSALAEQFFLEAATRILTTGIIPYFLLQSDSKVDWGTKHGAQLKNNFVHLILNAPRENGTLNYSKLRATLIYPGEKEQHSVLLPTGLPVFGESSIDVNLAMPAEVQPSELEQQILTLFDNGASRNAIAKQCYGIAGGKQYELIGNVLAKYGKE
jgi:hypothetical protein